MNTYLTYTGYSTFLIASKSDCSTMIRVGHWNIDFSLVMCHEKPLSRYHDKHLFPTIKDICNRKNSFPRYPNLFGSFCVNHEGIGWTFLRTILAFGRHVSSFSTKITYNCVFIMSIHLAIISIFRFVRTSTIS